MQILVKATAAVEPAEDTPADDPYGSFKVVLSAPTKDRDGETLLPEEWKQPLPEHITFDSDHQMSVAGTVGSGRPSIDDEGRLIVDGTFASTPQAQQVRALVNEGHIRTTSVAFVSEKVPAKDGKARIVRELLNGAFVAIPANREALVLSAKEAKAGRRNAATDMAMIQTIHDHTAALGADCGTKAAHLPQPATSLADSTPPDGDSPDPLLTRTGAADTPDDLAALRARALNFTRTQYETERIG